LQAVSVNLLISGSSDNYSLVIFIFTQSIVDSMSSYTVDCDRRLDSEQLTSEEYMSIINAKRYEENDRHLLIRKRFDQDANKTYWRWYHPADGGMHGTNSGKYAQFATLEEATDEALSHGYTYEIEANYK
jgi:hypothetical protein